MKNLLTKVSTRIFGVFQGHIQSNSKLARILKTALAITFAVGLALVVNSFSQQHSFLTLANMVNILRQMTFTMILAIGMTFVIITGGIDLSVGAVISLTGVVMAIVANHLPIYSPLAIGITLLVGISIGGLCGFISGSFVVRLKMHGFIPTYAMMQIALGLAFLISPSPIHVNNLDFLPVGQGWLFSLLLKPLGIQGIPTIVIWMAVLTIGYGVVLKRTRFGRYIYAIGGNEEAARLAGINTNRVKLSAYVISGSLAGVASFLLMSKFLSGAPQTGTVGWEFQAIAAAVVGGVSLMGGRGTILLTFLGALFIGVLDNIMNLANVNSYMQNVVIGGVILAAVSLDHMRRHGWSAKAALAAVVARLQRTSQVLSGK
jgi:ribose/xylose/arabinose/galactoside ABC-type transport system permease subunit